MTRTSGLILALVAGLAAGGCASTGSAGPATATPAPAASAGQTAKQYPPGIAKPSNTAATTKAELMLVKAEATKDTTAQQQDYQEALQSVQQGLQQDSLNPKLWYQQGQAYIGLGEFTKADAALKKALHIYPAYEPDVNSAREQAWIRQFNDGVKSMQASNSQAAIGHFEKAQVIYRQRPEALLNLASLYLQTQRPADAAAAYAKVLKIVNGPERQSMPAKVTKNWDSFAKLAETNLPQVYASMGVTEFQAQAYDSAAKDFRAALKLNPYYRDALHNLAQALYLRTANLEQREDSVSAAQKAQIQSELKPLYQQFRQASERVVQIDPYNGNALLLLARAYRGLGMVASTDSAKKMWQNKALAVLQKHEKLPFQITNMKVSMADTAITVKAHLENMTLDQGKQVTLKFTMLDAQGNTAGTQQVTVTAPAKQSATAFELTVPITKGESVLGWKYEAVPSAQGQS